MTLIDPPNTIVTKQMFVPSDHVFAGAEPGSALVIHKTAGFNTAEECAAYFQSGPPNNPGIVSSHFVVGQDGTVIQTVHLNDGAGANCCVEAGHNPYWDKILGKYPNLNTCTISIEHVDPATDNSTPLTSAQQDASFKLVKWLVEQYGFDTGDDGEQMVDIRGHDSLDPQSRARCPGNYPWTELKAFLKGNMTVNSSNPVTSTVRAEAEIEWNSTGTSAPVGTGIFNAWLNDYAKGIFHGPPLTKEVNAKDWNSKDEIVQMFAGARCKWQNGASTWYSYK